MGAFQPWHLIVIAIVGAVLFFGWKNLPDMARSAGRSLRVFKTEIKGMGDDDKAREARESEADAPKQLAPRPVAAPQPRVVPQAQVVPQSRVAASPAVEQPARSRPRPTPSPNGHARRG